MKNSSIFPILTLVLMALWLGATMVVDFVAVPTVFQTVTNIEQAGKVGLKVFSVFNAVEFILGLVLLFLFFLGRMKGKLLNLSLVILLSIGGFYNFYLSPKIGSLTHELRSKSYEEHGAEKYNQLENDHSFYHQLYVKTDAGKILILLVALVLNIKGLTHQVNLRE